MLIVSNKFKADVSNIDSFLKECGIREAKRSITIFLNRDEYKAGNAKIGRAILVNESVSDGTSSLTKLRIENSSILKVAVYYFDITLQNQNDIRNGIFTLTESYGVDKIISYSDKMTLDYDIFEYSYLLADTDNDIKDTILNSKQFSYVPPPKYYNELQMNYLEDGDFMNLLNYDNIMYYQGSELIDNFTEINISDIAIWDTMNPTLRNKIDNEFINGKHNKKYTIGDLSKSIFEPLANASLTDATFIFDSKQGMNIIGGSVPFRKYQIDSSIASDVDKCAKMFKLACKDIESVYGNIRVYVKPNHFGDIIRINCRDYDEQNQPFRPLKEDKQNITVDKSLPTTIHITDFINDTANLYNEY